MLRRTERAMRSRRCSRRIGSAMATSPRRSARRLRRSSPCSRPRARSASASCSWWRRRIGWSPRRVALRPRKSSQAMNVPGFVFNPISLAIEGAAIGFLIAVPVGPAAALCIRRTITVGAVAGYMTGIGAALGDAVFGAVAAFGLSFVEEFVIKREAWLLAIGGIGLVIMGWTTMRHRPRTVGDPVADDREHRVATHFHYASSSFFITVFNPVTVMAFGAAFASRNLAGVGASLPDAALLVGAVFCGALTWWTIICAASVSLRARFTGTGLLWLNRISGAIILGFGLVALISLLPLPWKQIGRSLGL